jgi:opacity protein-like surface antigen
MKKLLSILVFASTFCFGTENQIEFNLGRGTPLSSIQAGGSSDRAGSRGTAWSANFLHQAGPRYYVGLGGGQFRSNDNVSGTFVPNTPSTISSKITSILILTRVDIPSQSRLTPYVIAGIGWARNSLTVTARSGPGTLLDDSRNTVAYASGVGADYALSDRLFIGVEARYHNALKRTFTLTPQGQTTTGQSSVQTSLGVFMLGARAGIKY